MGFLNLKHVPSINFMGNRRVPFGISGALVLFVLLALLIKGVPYGVDFKGGAMVEVRAPHAVKLDDVRPVLAKALGSNASVQSLDTAADFLVRFDAEAVGDDKDATLSKITQAFGEGSRVRRFEAVGPKVSAELLQSGLYAIFLALLAMLLYIWFRFEWRYGLAALIALLHDCVAVLGLYAVARIEFNETAIVALLITASYSINDTVVVFDRVRENKGRYTTMPLQELLNLSVNETLSRTLLTSLTTLAALWVLYLFGGPVIAMFSLPILVGLFVGTYSSICLATPLLYLLSLSFHKTALVNQNNRHEP
ncbi:protein translocase subunit SecF [Candidatus Hepatobacter penaei]|uniref:protein translocase subunit SecF n=1 Tax=Candidatus Hepatobacter penaei TaxID=1274402 RepID=UPI000696A0EB|nr:protein translocase subunit SecF [Candidatus Hepatobacter penaei]TGW14623.1 protein translocase subunit SecF [bacterium NHP-B]